MAVCQVAISGAVPVLVSACVCLPLCLHLQSRSLAPPMAIDGRPSPLPPAPGTAGHRRMVSASGCLRSQVGPIGCGPAYPGAGAGGQRGAAGIDSGRLWGRRLRREPPSDDPGGMTGARRGSGATPALPGRRDCWASPVHGAAARLRWSASPDIRSAARAGSLRCVLSRKGGWDGRRA